MVAGIVSRRHTTQRRLGSSIGRSKPKEELLAWAAALARDSYRGTKGKSQDRVTPIYMQIDLISLPLRNAFPQLLTFGKEKAQGLKSLRENLVFRISRWREAGTESLGSFALCLLCAAVWVPRLRRSHGTPGQATIMIDANPALPGWATFSGRPSGPRWVWCQRQLLCPQNHSRFRFYLLSPSLHATRTYLRGFKAQIFVRTCANGHVGNRRYRACR
jgi:hypothetical protein